MDSWEDYDEYWKGKWVRNCLPLGLEHGKCWINLRWIRMNYLTENFVFIQLIRFTECACSMPGTMLDAGVWFLPSKWFTSFGPFS